MAAQRLSPRGGRYGVAMNAQPNADVRDICVLLSDVGACVRSGSWPSRRRVRDGAASMSSVALTHGSRGAILDAMTYAKILARSTMKMSGIAKNLRDLVEDVADLTVIASQTFAAEPVVPPLTHQAARGFDQVLLLLEPSDVAVPDAADTGWSRRDGVLFEIGYFLGCIDPSRLLIVICGHEPAAQPQCFGELEIFRFDTGDGKYHTDIRRLAERIRSPLALMHHSHPG